MGFFGFSHTNCCSDALLFHALPAVFRPFTAKNPCYTNNYIEIESPDRRREITNVIYGRLSALDPYLLSEFYNGDVATSKFILAYSIAKTDTLFFDFMAEIYREALLGDKHYLSIDDFDNFFAVKKQSDLIVAKWGDFTL